MAYFVDAIPIIGCSARNEGMTSVTSLPKVSGEVLTTVSYDKRRIDSQDVRIDGKTFAGQHGRTTRGVEVTCFLASEKCFTVNVSGTQFDVNQAGGSGVGGGTGYWITEGPW